MAAPPEKTIGDLDGKWILNTTLSDSVDPVLALQGVGWLVRTAIRAASVTLYVKQYSGPAHPPSASAEDITHIDIEQVATAGLKGTTERRNLDFVFREHSDWLFGRVRGRTKWIAADELAEFVKEGGEAREKGWINDDFLARDWSEKSEEGTEGKKNGPKGETHVFSFVESLDAGWTAMQVWGFQMIGGERRYTRNVVVAKKGTFVAIKMIYDYAPA